jgi:hypothetical protein
VKFKKGDLVMIVETTNFLPHFLGRVCTVAGPFLEHDYTDNFYLLEEEPEWAAKERCLRKIENPGDDAIDEMVALKGSPADDEALWKEWLEETAKEMRK